MRWPHAATSRVYVYCLSLEAIGRGDEALAQLAASARPGQRMNDMYLAAQKLVEGRRAESADAMKRAVGALADPEAHYHAARHFARIDERTSAVESLSNSIRGGYFCLAGMADDPWFDSLRNEPEFPTLLNQARARHESAAAAFREAGGPQLLGLGTDGG